MRGLETAFSMIVEMRSALFTMLPADSTMPSTRSSSLFTEVTVVVTSERSGTISWVMPSISVFVDARTTDVLYTAKHRKMTRTAQATARIMAAIPPQLTAITGVSLPACCPVGEESYRRRLAPVALRTPLRGVRRVATAFLPLARGLVVAAALELDGAVLLFHPVTRVIVRVLVALSVAELAQIGVAGLAEVKWDGVGGGRIFGGAPESLDDAVRLRRARKIDGRLGEVQPGFGQPDVLDRLRRCDGHEQRSGVGQPDVLGGVHDHPARDVARVLTGLDHPGQPEQRRVGIGPANALDERRDDVEMRVALAIVDDRLPLDALLGGSQVDLGEPFRLRRMDRGLEAGERHARVAARDPR